MPQTFICMSANLSRLWLTARMQADKKSHWIRAREISRISTLLLDLYKLRSRSARKATVLDYNLWIRGIAWVFAKVHRFFHLKKSCQFVNAWKRAHVCALQLRLWREHVVCYCDVSRSKPRATTISSKRQWTWQQSMRILTHADTKALVNSSQISNWWWYVLFFVLLCTCNLQLTRAPLQLLPRGTWNRCLLSAIQELCHLRRNSGIRTVMCA